ncbi:uncharacterized protein LOC110933656 [Helianthus annuus]|uniref:uncharacterized protein LOC110933656 n=1 Tax=Helianthus annuus TaxID=4232 RepID=UPI000B8FF234|nr:uncharacterized protein LOC110933656 [Helianthus annuus]
MCSIADRCVKDGGVSYIAWHWSKLPSSEDEIKEREDCERLLEGFSVTNSVDVWKWNSMEEDIFSVALAKKWISDKIDVSSRLPTKVALQRRNIIEGCACSLCEDGPDGDETTEHLFTACGIAAGVWNCISSWCGISIIYAFSVKDLLELHNNI